jgi:uncharacterized cofD-like protein
VLELNDSVGSDARPTVVAIGGGHGLAATLSALHRLPVFPVAVVGTADDGGSSGRLRAEYACVPPGDMRMALGALLGASAEADEWRTLMHQRFASGTSLEGHAIGNLMLVALLQQHDPVTALTLASRLFGIDGIVLPAATVPLDLEADVAGLSGLAEHAHVVVRGQVAVAQTSGNVTAVRVSPTSADAPDEVVQHILAADVITLGPGSWWTSVMPPLLLPALHDAVLRTSALRVLILNLGAQTGETSGYTAAAHLDVLHRSFPQLTLDVVIADPRFCDDQLTLSSAAEHVGARVEFGDIAALDADGQPTQAHDPELLAAVIGRVLDKHGRINACP